MFTTEGIALRAAPLNDVIGGWLAVSSRGSCGSLIVTTSLRRFQESRSGRSVETTNSTAREMVAVWQNVSHSLRMEIVRTRRRGWKEFLETQPLICGEFGTGRAGTTLFPDSRNYCRKWGRQ